MSLACKILVLITVVALSHSAVTVNELTGVTPQNLLFSGTIPISATNNLFFTYYGVDGEKDKNLLKNSPLLIVVGNPGTSAQYYSLSGIGPLNLNRDMTLTANPDSFTNTANVMFLDLLGSGFSFASNTADLPTQGRKFGQQLSLAINTFVKESVLGQSSKIIIAGESTFIRSLPGLDDIDALKGIIHLSIWPELYAIGRYYGIAGVELKIYTESERVAIDSTFSSCYSQLRNAKYLEAHQCLDSVFNFIESKTKNTNLFDVRLSYSLTEFQPMVQYYFSLPETVTKWKAPASKLFEGQSGYIANKTYVDLAKNYTKDLSQYMKDYYSVRHWFAEGLSDFISYYKGIRNWVQNQLVFVDSDAFKKAKLQDIVIDGVTVGYAKSVKQVTYTEIINSGHHLFHDAPKTLNYLFKTWVASIKEEIKSQYITTE